MTQGEIGGAIAQRAAKLGLTPWDIAHAVFTSPDFRITPTAAHDRIDMVFQGRLYGTPSARPSNPQRDLRRLSAILGTLGIDNLDPLVAAVRGFDNRFKHIYGDSAELSGPVTPFESRRLIRNLQHPAIGQEVQEAMNKRGISSGMIAAKLSSAYGIGAAGINPYLSNLLNGYFSIRGTLHVSEHSLERLAVVFSAIGIPEDAELVGHVRAEFPNFRYSPNPDYLIKPSDIPLEGKLRALTPDKATKVALLVDRLYSAHIKSL